MPRFKRYVKKLPRQFQQVVLDAVEEILADPEAGQLKKGDLNGFRIHKFTMGRQLTLMAYKVENDSLVLYQVGPHENFYKNLKKYLKEIGG
ncbi:MAG: type II toxin-antitoxin system RelE/ParE family toxin [Proteobacteria bacterium]|nr:type II toxin-antitoxin system RelE/ParE family toxin [Pseudomonadota bacterium]MBU4013705.1 type II toxin-antitoxin system RelE/ParE family toxin [Pseudomonadota bacterium]MBU4068262.1 type II toxin-antitoxin system RelE/ParE family toxin [Pseudomonadota bacterium]MBU4101916.1 type II toxin-antitoxin system RelE/ParE family toxin [Pseudomonadota bacterium]